MTTIHRTRTVCDLYDGEHIIFEMEDGFDISKALVGYDCDVYMIRKKHGRTRFGLSLTDEEVVSMIKLSIEIDREYQGWITGNKEATCTTHVIAKWCGYVEENPDEAIEIPKLKMNTPAYNRPFRADDRGLAPNEYFIRVKHVTIRRGREVYKTRYEQRIIETGATTETWGGLYLTRTTWEYINLDDYLTPMSIWEDE